MYYPGSTIRATSILENIGLGSALVKTADARANLVYRARKPERRIPCPSVNVSSRPRSAPARILPIVRRSQLFCSIQQPRPAPIPSGRPRLVLSARPGADTASSFAPGGRRHSASPAFCERLLPCLVTRRWCRRSLRRVRTEPTSIIVATDAKSSEPCFMAGSPWHCLRSRLQRRVGPRGDLHRRVRSNWISSPSRRTR